MVVVGVAAIDKKVDMVYLMRTLPTAVFFKYGQENLPLKLEEGDCSSKVSSRLLVNHLCLISQQ